MLLGLLPTSLPAHPLLSYLGMKWKSLVNFGIPLSCFESRLWPTLLSSEEFDRLLHDFLSVN